jgi:hypothetical protein
MPFIASLTGLFLHLAQFEGWVEQCAKAVRNDNVSNPCIVILHDRNLPNSRVCWLYGWISDFIIFHGSILMGAVSLLVTTFYTFLPCFLFIFVGRDCA